MICKTEITFFALLLLSISSTNLLADQMNERLSIQIIRDTLGDRSPAPEMVVIPAGKFRMGNATELAKSYEQPVHDVTLPVSFSISRYPITFDEYDKFTQARGKPLVDDFHWGRGKRPVINVNVSDANDYAQWLNEQTGHRYRLPSEAEWEYAARAGSVTHYPWGDEIGIAKANCKRCGSSWDKTMTSPVGQFEANAWGLFDTQGNVWEMTADCWNYSYDGAPSNGQSWRKGDCTRTVLRGGSWGDPPIDLRTSARLRSYAGTRTVIIGFRLVREID